MDELPGPVLQAPLAMTPRMKQAVCTFLLLVAVAIQLPAQQPVSSSITNKEASLDFFSDAHFNFLNPKQDTLKEAQAAYELDARTNHIKLDKPQYTNAPWSEIRLRASALAGDGLAASLCSGSNALNELFWLSLAATNGWLPSQVRLAKEYEFYERPKDRTPRTFTLDEAYDSLLEVIQKQPSEIRQAAAKLWRGKAQAGLARVKADASRNDARALYALGLLHQSGDLVESNAILTAEMFHKAAESGLAPAQEAWGSYCAWHLTNSLEAAGWYYRAATQGLAGAQAYLSVLHSRPSAAYFDRYFQPKACEGARWTFERASQPVACFSSCSACVEMGELCLNGLGVESNAVEAVKWYHRAIDLGSPYGGGEYNLALCYFGGDGVPQDDAEGSKWLQRAKDKGDYVDISWDESMATDAWKRGDYHTALKYWRKNAALGNAEAQYILGGCYSQGKGVAKDEAEAVKWYRKAAEQNYAEAQSNLGYCYQNGQGVVKDYTEAVKWYRKAAEQSLPAAQFNLGVCYYNGQGVAKDYVEGYRWWLLAAGQGDGDARKGMTSLELLMTREQIAEGQKLARNFKPRVVPPAGSDSSGTAIAQTRPESSGTGFFITEDGYLVTNEHVVENAVQVRLVTEASLRPVFQPDENEPSVRVTGIISAKVVKVDAANDLALLKAEGKFTALPVVSSRAMRLGSAVATVGFPNIGLQGFAPKLAKGEIAALSGAQDDARYFQISVPVQPGNSGGALVDERGNVVGVVSAKLNVMAALATSGALPENVNYAVKSSLLLSFLESVPAVSAKLKEAETKDRKFEDVVRSAEKAAVLVLVY